MKTNLWHDLVAAGPRVVLIYQTGNEIVCPSSKDPGETERQIFVGKIGIFKTIKGTN